MKRHPGPGRSSASRSAGSAPQRSITGEVVSSVARLANAAAHEINNPLTVIIGNLELLAREVDTRSFAHARLQAALEAAERIREIVHCMRHVARLEVVASGPNLPEMLDLEKSSTSMPERQPEPLAAPAVKAS